MSYDLGDVVPLSWETKDDAGVAVDPDVVTLTITKPDATTETPVVTNPSVGNYLVNYAAVDPGYYGVRWVGTGDNAQSHTDQFDIRQANPTLIFSFKDGLSLLNKVTEDEYPLVRDFIESTTEFVEDIVGPVIRRPVTEIVRMSGRNDYFATQVRPIISIDSITPIHGSYTYSVDDFDLDTKTGIVRLTSGRFFQGTHRIVYDAGREHVPASIRDASKIILRYLWSVRLSATGGPRERTPSARARAIIMSDETMENGWFPRAAIALLNKEAQAGGFA